MNARTPSSANILIDSLTADAGPGLRADARAMLLEYGQFILSQPGSAQFCFGSLEQEAAEVPESFLGQGGGCLLARVHGEPRGFVAWRALNGKVQESLPGECWEIKRLWVRPQARGLGLGRLLTQSVLDRAQAAGRRAVYLDTVPATMASAYRLYLEMGFVPCDKYNDNSMDGIAFLVKRFER